MRSDVTRWTHSCLVCLMHSPGHPVKAPLTPIPVSGPFDKIGVDVIQLPKTAKGNQFACTVVFIDYLPEVFAVPEQTAATIAKLLIEEIMSRHGVPAEVLSDCGKAFLSGLMEEVGQLLGIHKFNTSAYHPQTGGLVERYNRTLRAMLSKTVEHGKKNWDEPIPYVLFAYRACLQESTKESPFFLLYGRDPRLPSQEESTKESPFFLLYGRDPRLPSQAMLSPAKMRRVLDLREYGAELYERMSAAWEGARAMIKQAQNRQKLVYDRRGRYAEFITGERVFLLQPSSITGELRKLA